MSLRPYTRLVALCAFAGVLAVAGVTLFGGRDGTPRFDIHTETFGGRVTQVLAAGSYTYFSLVDERGTGRWVVTSGDKHAHAMHLRVRSFGRRHDFYSERLDRRFDDLYFVSVLETEDP